VRVVAAAMKKGCGGMCEWVKQAVLGSRAIPFKADAGVNQTVTCFW